MDITEKLQILTDAAKYDVSCSSSGSRRKNRGGIGQAASSGICHSWSEDGRCISLLKVLLTNRCVYNCRYCVNRREHLCPRASFTPRELVDLTLHFYRRNYIEGLFLSSAVEKSPDDTMIQLIEVARLLREEENFTGYIHMKGIPGASPELIRRLGFFVDRMSVNIELPTPKALALLAPEKKEEQILKPMNQLMEGIGENRRERKHSRKLAPFLPAGQSTQMIVGASRETDWTILKCSHLLYQTYAMKRVFYSAFVPVVASPYTEGLPKVPLLREHRLYQADWLLRFYGFQVNELFDSAHPNMDLHMDPKLLWAIQHPERFPIELNRASYEVLLRVPGLGRRSVNKIISARRYAPLHYDDLKALRISVKRACPFITVQGKYYWKGPVDPRRLYSWFRNQQRATPAAEQLSFL